MIHKLIFTIFWLVVMAFTVHAQSGLICGDPMDKGCRPQYDAFEANDLTFLTGRAQLGTGTRHESEEFYAVILQSVKAASNKNRMGCDFISERSVWLSRSWRHTTKSSPHAMAAWEKRLLATQTSMRITTSWQFTPGPKIRRARCCKK